jgi:hypothetical protein
MFLYPPAGYDWPKPWGPITAESRCLEFPQIMGNLFGGYDAAPTLAAELQRECCPEHPLHGRSCVAVARADDDPNEFVFVTDNPEFPIAFVHLTWAIERSPTWPYTVGYRSWEEFQAAWAADEG